MVETQSEARELVLKWYERAQIDYSDLYARLYIAYNAWFRQVTRTSFDREAISRLTKRFVIWDDYVNGRVLQDLKPLMAQIVYLTAEQPLVGNRWDGIVHDALDWRGLIHYWYQVRCDLFHGTVVVNEKRVRLAYESLNVFMQEITDRMKRCFTQEDYVRLEEIQALIQSSPQDRTRLKSMQEVLHQKFISSPDIWNVDMVRV